MMQTVQVLNQLHVPLMMLAAVLLDQWLGEPRRWHPLVGFGNYAMWLERRLNADNRICETSLPPCRGKVRMGVEQSGHCASTPSPALPLQGGGSTRVRGMLAWFLALAPFLAVAIYLRQQPLLQPWIDVLVLYFALGMQSLREHAARIQYALQADDLQQARRRVGEIVSRDTSAMQAQDVARAGVESVLENGNDAVFGALFWFAVAGAPGVLLYRLSNTLDAMWGYRNARYNHFGWAAARLDDVLNFIPARLTALTYALLGNTRIALHCWRQQAPAWDSPNAGPVMASGAGSLMVALGGAANYHGVDEMRPMLGAGSAPHARDIARAIALVQRGVWLWLAVLLLIGLLHG